MINDTIIILRWSNPLKLPDCVLEVSYIRFACTRGKTTLTFSHNCSITSVLTVPETVRSRINVKMTLTTDSSHPHPSSCKVVLLSQHRKQRLLDMTMSLFFFILEDNNSICCALGSLQIFYIHRQKSKYLKGNIQ